MCGGPTTPSRPTDGTLECVFVENIQSKLDFADIDFAENLDLKDIP